MRQQPDYKSYVESRLMTMRTVRYSWWQHWRELADYFLPRRYKWIVTPNTNDRGSPINQRILDSTGVLANRNLASGLMSGKVSPSQPWLKLKINKVDSTGTTPASLWLSECERLMSLVMHESNFYTSIAAALYDLCTFGTATLLIYEDFDNVIDCRVPCAGEYYVDLDGKNRPTVLCREFTMTVSALVAEFGYENCSEAVQRSYDSPPSGNNSGSSQIREVLVGHMIEPNDDGRGFCPDHFEFRECYWERGSSDGTQSTGAPPGFLRQGGFHDQPQATVRWDIVSNDPYGRSPAMDALPDQKQLQLATKRKAQAIDKMVNPPLVADVRLKNRPTSLLPGGVTYVDGFTASGKPGIGSIYDTAFPIAELKEDLEEVRDRIKKTFFNDLFQPISQFETRSNITAVEINQRKAESLIMLGPVFERLDNEFLRVIVERIWGIMSRAGIFPPAPPEIAGKDMNIEFVSMLALAQNAARSSGIQQVFGLVGNIIGVRPEVGDNIDWDFAIDNFSALLDNDPRMIKSADDVAAIRAQKAQQAAQAQRAQQAQQLAMSAKNLAAAPESGSPLESLMGGGQ